LVAERDEDYSHTARQEYPSEHLLHLLWQRQALLQQPLTTLDRRPLTVYRPGRWTRTNGPDFRDAKLRFGDDPLRVGAVEVHVLASDWFRHRHDRDMAYADVLLHVIWHNDLEGRGVTDATGRPIPQLALSTSLTRPLVELQNLLEGDRSPSGSVALSTPCQRALQELAPEVIGHLLDMAGEERWRQKANRFALRVERRGVEQALYESVLESLGFQGNRLPFWQLARLAPVERVRAALGAAQPAPLRLQAVFFGVSGFLQHWRTLPRPASPEVETYLATLLAHWEPLAPSFPERVDERQWRTAGIRPANFPQRRIAAAGHLLADVARHSLVDLLLGPLRAIDEGTSRRHMRSGLHELVRRLQVTGEGDFWGRRYTLTGIEQGRRIELLGSGRATTMVVDVLLPAAAALVQLGHEAMALDVVHGLYRCHPRLPSNEITRDMLRQFFGADRERLATVDSACRQQGLIQLYRDYCLNELETCQECAFPRLVARLEGLRRGAPPAAP
jgi:hypothetical protein